MPTASVVKLPRKLISFVRKKYFFVQKIFFFVQIYLTPRPSFHILPEVFSANYSANAHRPQQLAFFCQTDTNQAISDFVLSKKQNKISRDTFFGYKLSKAIITRRINLEY